MIHDEAWEWVRFLNAVLSLAVFASLLAGTVVRWEGIPLRLRRIIPWICMTYGIVAYGSIETARLETFVPAGFRVGLTTINLIGLIIALLYGMGDERYHYGDRKRAFLEREEGDEKK